MSRTFLATLVATTAVLGARAHADTLRLDARFHQPIVTPIFHAKWDEKTYVTKLAKKCDPQFNYHTSREPSFTFQVTENVSNLRLRLMLGEGYPALIDGFVLRDDGTYFCTDEHRAIYLKDWPAGTYHVYLYGNQTLEAGVVIDAPVRAKADALAARDAMTPIVLDGTGANPRSATNAPSVIVEPAVAGFTCKTGLGEHVTPIGALDVEAAGKYVVGGGAYVTDRDGHCDHVSRDEVELAAGPHTVWATVRGDQLPKSAQVDVRDLSRPLVFDDAPVKELGALDQPLVLDATIRPAVAWRAGGGCAGTARTPDFYLSAKTPLAKVTLSALWAPGEPKINLYGPIGEKDAAAQCGAPSRSFDVLAGTYAVWISGDAGTNAHLLARLTDAKLDPLTSFAAPPDDASVADRAVKHYYPYFADDGGRDPRPWMALFEKAPMSMFVYTNEGEPVLVDNDRDFRRYDGTPLSIDARLLTTTKPASVKLPAEPTVPVIDNLQSAMEVSGPEDQKSLDAWVKRRDAYQACIDAYLEKHDPTWGHGGTELYKIKGNGDVVNVSDEVGRKADAHCGRPAFEKARDALTKQLGKTRAARYRASLAAVRARF
ncbi:MAG TPA: hypothetical protein VL463_05660 [Kofleriaceae bacterium]|nr:hypothetical protein [Kofleriaceae bacterium]